MATIVNTTVNSLADYQISTWTPLTTTDTTGDGAGHVGAGDRTVQVTGTFGTGGTLILEGTVDGTNWAQLRDPSSTLISFTAAGIKAVLENVVAVRPRVTGGDGTTSLTVTLIARRK